MVVPGSPEDSLLFWKVSTKSPPVGREMPPALPMVDADELALIEAWIAAGAPYE